jgi:excisionase family DNA binding protein
MENAIFISVKEAAKALSVSERFLRQLVKHNRVPFYKLSERTTRFDFDELRHYMRLIAEGKPVADDGASEDE